MIIKKLTTYITRLHGEAPSDRQTHTETNPLIISESLALETHHTIPYPDTEILVRSPDAALTGRAFWHDNILINENDQLIYCHNLR